VIDNDAFLSKYDAAGNLLWVRILGVYGQDLSHGVLQTSWETSLLLEKLVIAEVQIHA
jgi:hypothetical protein